MSSFLLRVEGVNLANFVYDTQNLSTIRGGGLLLLDAAVRVRSLLLDSGCKIEPIIEGASIGLFRVDTDRTADNVRRVVAEHLSGWQPHATFVVDVNDTTSTTPDGRELVLARNRWRQMQSPTVVYPAVGGTTKNTRVCEVDMVRPAADDGTPVSESVRVRREYGRDKKQSFYVEEMRRTGLPEPLNLKYTADFEELCGNSNQWGNLRDKMALVYIDGNKFGIFEAQCTTETELRDFSRGLRGEQARLLRRLIEERINGEESWQNFDRVRLETLLWGGDEIIWVVPAWKGWEILQFFFAHWVANPTPTWLQPHQATWSAGLVFCHKKAPIHTVVKLAKDLADCVKNDNKTRDDLFQNRFLYRVLESFDHIGDVDPKLAPLILPADQMAGLAENMGFFRETLSRKKLHRAVASKDAADQAKAVEEMRKDLAKDRDSAASVLAGINALEAVARDKVWEHIVELWDYVSPEESRV